MGDSLLPTSEFYRLEKSSGQVSYASGVYDLQQTRFLFSRSSYNIWKTVQTKCDQRVGMGTQEAAGRETGGSDVLERVTESPSGRDGPM